MSAKGLMKSTNGLSVLNMVQKCSAICVLKHFVLEVLIQYLWNISGTSSFSCSIKFFLSGTSNAIEMEPQSGAGVPGTKIGEEKLLQEGRTLRRTKKMSPKYQGHGRPIMYWGMSCDVIRAQDKDLMHSKARKTRKKFYQKLDSKFIYFEITVARIFF